MASRFGPSSDFSPIAARYDATRDIPAPCLQICYDRLIGLGLFPPRGLVLDAGCGTGQISLPLAERGYEVLGVDLSSAMARLAQAKPRSCGRAAYVAADVRAVPARDGAFDAAVVSKLFMHVADWRLACCDLVRVLRPGGVMLHVRDVGAFGNAVRRAFAERADAAGYALRFPGLRPDQSPVLLDHMASLGCAHARVDMADVTWRVEISHGDVLDQFGERLFAEFWPLPPVVYGEILDAVAAWVASRPHGRATMNRLDPHLVIDVFTRHAGETGMIRFDGDELGESRRIRSPTPGRSRSPPI